MDFESYLISKKIDGPAFRKAEPEVYETWRGEFSQMHPNSFTVQKLNLINPIRRKYQLKETQLPPPPPAGASSEPNTPAKPVAPKPMIKPKPKIS